VDLQSALRYHVQISGYKKIEYKTSVEYLDVIKMIVFKYWSLILQNQYGKKIVIMEHLNKIFYRDDVNDLAMRQLHQLVGPVELT
jgi:hypothetical protein